MRLGLSLALVLAFALTPLAADTPEEDAWHYTGSLNAARYGHTATRLADGRVVVAGGYASNHWLSSAELYDPASGLPAVGGAPVPVAGSPARRHRALRPARPPVPPYSPTRRSSE